VIETFMAATVLAAALPKVAYKPDPARSSDVGAVELRLPSRHPCFGVTRASVLLSVGKTDGGRIWVLTATVADSSAPEQITGATAGGQPLKLVSVRNGDVACTEYQCPAGSAAVFELPEAARASAAATPVQVATSSGGNCNLNLNLEPAVFAALDDWAGKLKR